MRCAISGCRHSGWRVQISVAEIAIGESRKTCMRLAASRLSSMPSRRKKSISCARSSAKVGMMTLPPRVNVSVIAAYNSSTDGSSGLCSRSP